LRFNRSRRTSSECGRFLWTPMALGSFCHVDWKQDGVCFDLNVSECVALSDGSRIVAENNTTMKGMTE